MSGRDRADEEAAAARVLAAFGARFAERAPFRDDRELVDELVREAQPAAHALLFALTVEVAADESSLEHHEGIAMVHLLGRRAALLGASPAAATALVPALLAALEDEALRCPDGFAQLLASTCVEGFVRGREERLRDAMAGAAADAQPTLEVLPACRALVLCGDHEPERLAGRAEAFGRELFASEARVAIVDISALRGPDRHRAAAVADVREACALLGARFLVAGADAEWREALADASVPEEACVPTFGDALDAALRTLGLALRPRMKARFERLLRGPDRQ